MVDKEVSITRLQNTLLRLPKDDLIKLLKSTYQAMRIKHGIPYERALSSSITSSINRAQKEKGNKLSTPSRTKTKSSVSRKKQTENLVDTHDYYGIEQPTFRQVEPFVESFKDLDLSASSSDSDRPFQNEHVDVTSSTSNQRNAPPPTQCVLRQMNDNGFAVKGVHDVDVDALSERLRYLNPVPPLDLTRMGSKEKDPRISQDVMTAKGKRNQRPSNAFNDTEGGSSPFRTAADTAWKEQQQINAPSSYAQHFPVASQYGPRFVGSQVPYNTSTRQGPCLPPYNATLYAQEQAQIYQAPPQRPIYHNQMAYHDSYQLRTPGPFHVRGRSVQRK